MSDSGFPSISHHFAFFRGGVRVLPSALSKHEFRWRVRDTRVTIGRGTYGAPALVLYSAEDRVVIGNYCSLAGGCYLVAGGEHHTDKTTTFPLTFYHGGDPGADAPDPAKVRYADARYKGPLTIGSDVWIGFRAMVLSGVTIGHGAVVGAGAVVAADVPPYAIVVGNPARVARYRLPDDVISELLRIRWWDWSPARVAEYQALLLGDPRRFLDVIDKLPAGELAGYYGPDPREDQMDYRPVRSLWLARIVPPALKRLVRWAGGRTPIVRAESES